MKFNVPKAALAALAAAVALAVGATAVAIDKPADKPADKPVAARPAAKPADPATAATIAAIRAKLGERLGTSAPPIGDIRKLPQADLWEVQLGDELAYTDSNAELLLVGAVFETRTRKNLTQTRMDELTQVAFKDLPLDLASKSVHGKGERVLAVFVDPNCGYCKRFEAALKATDNLTLYRFYYPVLGEDSVTKSRLLWCAPQREKAWQDWMLEGKAPEGKGDCENPVDRTVALGKKLRVTGTPTLILADGKRIPGAIDANALETALQQAGKR
ncbi:DsbC family protein [Derxia gummosa]|uniref:Thiol:disulfide interchange protein n=1 Tax=Derxia gummosa DSM 723 TaxID=1121388 RepID=A0A8B6XBE4_9BURK|nr:DsbC family protein [Derxia gummosa]